MARLYAQLCTLIFFAVGLGGLLVGSARPAPGGQAGGNLGSLTLHMTWARDAVDIGLLAIFVYVGFVGARQVRIGRLLTFGAGAILVALAIIGLAVGDNDAATKGVLGMHFPAVINAFDLIMGVLAILCALGTIEEHVPAG